MRPQRLEEAVSAHGDAMLLVEVLREMMQFPHADLGQHVPCLEQVAQEKRFQQSPSQEAQFHLIERLVRDVAPAANGCLGQARIHLRRPFDYRYHSLENRLLQMQVCRQRFQPGVLRLQLFQPVRKASLYRL